MNGYISKRGENSYSVRFYNPITVETIFVGNVTSLEEAEELYYNYEINFYKDKTYLLPKCIFVSKYNDTLRFKVSFNIKRLGKYNTWYLGSFRTLREAKKAKSDFINNII